MIAALERSLLVALGGLDTLRSDVLRVCGAPARLLLRDRAARVAVAAGLGVLLALTLTALSPLMLLAFGPLVLGVPHLLADLRYMIVRQGLARRRSLWLLVVPCLSMCLIQPRLSWGTAAIAAAILAARAPVTTRLAALAVCALVAWTAQQIGPRADILFAHAHNLVALAIWTAWARGTKRQVLPGLVLYVAGSVLIFSGALECVLPPGGALAPSPATVDARALVAALSPVKDPTWALRWLLFFAFSQSVHYAVWLRLIPDEARERAGIRPFAASYRALREELGRAVVILSLLATLALLAFACVDLQGARAAYLRLALFHGPLEIATAVLLWLERRRRA